MENKEINS